MSETKQEPGCECPARRALEHFKNYFHHRARADNSIEFEVVGDRLIEAALSDPCSCEQLREQAQSAQSDAFRWMKAHDGILGSAAQMVEDARAATNAVNAKLAAARSLLEEAQARMKWIAEWYTEDDPRSAGVRAAMRIGDVELVCNEIDAARKLLKVKP